jgi:hypothetical protein
MINFWEKGLVGEELDVPSSAPSRRNFVINLGLNPIFRGIFRVLALHIDTL